MKYGKEKLEKYISVKKRRRIKENVRKGEKDKRKGKKVKGKRKW